MTKDTFELKRWARWLGTFIGFPLAGVAARVVAGNIDSVSAAALGGWPPAWCSVPYRSASAGSVRANGSAGSAPPPSGSPLA